MGWFRVVACTRSETATQLIEFLCVLRAERESLSLLHFLRDHDKPQFRRGGLNALSSDQTLSEAVRQRALQFAREWKP